MEVWVIVGTQLVAAGAIIGAIRADLKHVEREVARAHDRIDELFSLGVSHG